jgi:hypothetical protein
MPEYITAINWNERGRRLAQVWVIGGHKVAEIEMPPGASQKQTWDTAEWLCRAVLRAEDAQDQRETQGSVIAASHHI